MQATVAQVEQDAWNAMIEMASSGDIESSQVLMQAATQYLTDIAGIEDELNRFKLLLKDRSKYSKLNKSGSLTTQDAITLTRIRQDVSTFLHGDIPKRLYHVAFAFQKVLNAVLGQTVKMVYVYQGENGPELYEVVNEDILSFDTSSRHQLTARYNAAAKDLGSALKRLELTEQVPNYNLANLNATYNETVRRYNISRQHNNYVVICWPGGQDYVAKVSALGDINEAYAAAIILNLPSPTFESDLEQNIYDFLTSYVLDVDNVSGLLQGDVSKDNIEYGIKSAQASTLGLAQMKKLAQQIVQSGGTFDKEKLNAVKEKFRAKGKTRNNISKLVDKTFDQLINEFVAGLPK